MFRVKVCGVTTIENAQEVVGAGADALGFNFCLKSRRYIDPKTAQGIATEITKPAMKVGLFVNASLEHIQEVNRLVGLDMIQLHGDESPEFIADLADMRVMKALRVEDGKFDAVLEYLDRCFDLGVQLDALLLDAFAPGKYGGTGEIFDWKSLAARRSELSLPVVLAGGLNPQNVAEAIRIAKPDAVDVSSGVEDSPGHKLPAMVSNFVNSAHQAFQLSST